jgi:serine/threonine-protein kinase
MDCRARLRRGPRALARDEERRSSAQARRLEIGSLLELAEWAKAHCARDTRLGRDVAIKVLPPMFCPLDGGAVRTEARPGVPQSSTSPRCSVSDVDGVRALVLELVEGPTLADVIAQHGVRLPVEECLRIARQLAGARRRPSGGHRPSRLEARQHQADAGRRGQVLDFGLARPATLAAGAPDAMMRGAPLIGRGGHSPGSAWQARRPARISGRSLRAVRDADGPAFGRDTDLTRGRARTGPDWAARRRRSRPGAPAALVSRKAPPRLRDIADARLDAGRCTTRASVGRGAGFRRASVLIAAVLAALRWPERRGGFH